MMKKIFVILSMFFVKGFAVESPSDKVIDAQKTPLVYLRTVNTEEINNSPYFSDHYKIALLSYLDITLNVNKNDPRSPATLSKIVLENCRIMLASFYARLSKNNQRLPPECFTYDEQVIRSCCMRQYLLIYNLIRHHASIYYNGSIPEGFLNFSAPGDYHLCHLKTNSGSIFIPALNMKTDEKILSGFLQCVAINPRGEFERPFLIYSNNAVNHESGFFLSLENATQVWLSAYLGRHFYRTSDKVFCHKDSDVAFLLDASNYTSPLLKFVVSQIATKIGDFSKLTNMMGNGMLIFLPFPIIPQEQTESAYAEDLFQAQEALTDIARTNFLLGAIPEFVEDRQKQTENAEKRARILNKKREAEAKLARLNADYQTTTETLVSTLEGRLLSLNEAEYQQMVADEQAKISAQLQKRSQPGVLAGKKLSRREKKQAKEAEAAENRRLEEALATLEQKVRAGFIEKIKGRYHDKRHVLKSFHEHLAENGIHFYETQDGSHRITHVEGAKSVTVVEEHKGSVPFSYYSGKTIHYMLKVFGDALKQKTLVDVVAKKI